MIDLSEAHSLCSKSELNLVEASFAPKLEMLTPSNLRSKIDGVGKLHQKCTAMIKLLHSDARIATTRRKVQLFEETIGRLEAPLNEQTAQGIEGPAEKHDDTGTVLEIPQPGVDGRPDGNERQLEGRDRRILSDLA